MTAYPYQVAPMPAVKYFYGFRGGFRVFHGGPWDLVTFSYYETTIKAYLGKRWKLEHLIMIHLDET